MADTMVGLRCENRKPLHDHTHAQAHEAAPAVNHKTSSGTSAVAHGGRCTQNGTSIFGYCTHKPPQHKQQDGQYVQHTYCQHRHTTLTDTIPSSAQPTYDNGMLYKHCLWSPCITPPSPAPECDCCHKPFLTVQVCPTDSQCATNKRRQAELPLSRAFICRKNRGCLPVTLSNRYTSTTLSLWHN